jgi:hypothetical protein
MLDPKIQFEVDKIQASWSEDRRYCREHGHLMMTSNVGMAVMRSRSTVKIPRFRGLHPNRKPHGSWSTWYYEDRDLFFDYAKYVLDHLDTS